MKCAIKLLLAFLLLQGCGGKPSKPVSTPTSGVAVAYFDETIKPVLEQEVAVFHSIYPDAAIHARYVSETDALNALLKDSAQVVVVSRDLKSSEIKFLNQKQLYPRSSKIAVDAVALIVNKSNTDSLISMRSLKRILQGEISSWNALNGASQLGTIKVVFDNRNSSTVRLLLDSLCRGKKLSSNLSSLYSNEEVIAYVTSHSNALGIVGVSWVANKHDSLSLSFLEKVRVVGVSKEDIPSPSNAFLPFQAYLATRQYPLARQIYSITVDPSCGLPTGFAAFLASDRGQRIILRSGILPLTQPLRLVQVDDGAPE